MAVAIPYSNVAGTKERSHAGGPRTSAFVCPLSSSDAGIGNYRSSGRFDSNGRHSVFSDSTPQPGTCLVCPVLGCRVAVGFMDYSSRPGGHVFHVCTYQSFIKSHSQQTTRTGKTNQRDPATKIERSTSEKQLTPLPKSQLKWLRKIQLQQECPLGLSLTRNAKVNQAKTSSITMPSLTVARSGRP